MLASAKFSLKGTDAKLLELKELQQSGELPALSFEKPAADDPLLAVEMTHFDHLKPDIVLYVFFAIFALPALPGFLMDGAFNILTFGALCFLVVILSSRDLYEQYSAKPCVLELYRQGLWLPHQKVFVPYERLVAFVVHRARGGMFTMRHMRISFFALPEEKAVFATFRIRINDVFHRVEMLAIPDNVCLLNLSAQDGVLNMPYEEIVEHVSATAAACTDQKGLIAPICRVEN